MSVIIMFIDVVHKCVKYSNKQTKSRSIDRKMYLLWFHEVWWKSIVSKYSLDCSYQPAAASWCMVAWIKCKQSTVISQGKLNWVKEIKRKKDWLWFKIFDVWNYKVDCFYLENSDCLTQTTLLIKWICTCICWQPDRIQRIIAKKF